MSGTPEDFLRIDPLRLDEQLQEQPVLMWHWSEQRAQAAHALADARRELELFEACERRSIRDRPSLYGIEKTTVDAVQDALTVQPGYQQAVEALNKAKALYDSLSAVVSAIVDRKHGLQASVELHMMSYGADVRLEDRRSGRRSGEPIDPSEIGGGDAG